MSDEPTIKEPSERVRNFLAALRRADSNEFCRPPGLSGVYKAKWIRLGLDTQAIGIHRSGQGLSNLLGPDHVRGHCRCPNCTWEWLMRDEDDKGPRKESPPLPTAPVQGPLFGSVD